MEFQDQDLALARQALKAMKSGTYEVPGDQVIIFAAVIKWLEGLEARLKTVKDYQPPKVEVEKEVKDVAIEGRVSRRSKRRRG